VQCKEIATGITNIDQGSQRSRGPGVFQGMNLTPWSVLGRNLSTEGSVWQLTDLGGVYHINTCVLVAEIRVPEPMIQLLITEGKVSFHTRKTWF
jgi:hypothetical protein